MAHALHMMCKVLTSAFLICGIFAASASSNTYSFNFDVFTDNGIYGEDPGLRPYVVVSNGEEAIVDFTFYNMSLFRSSVAQIYFDDGSLLGISYVINSSGTNFAEKFPGPGNLPSGQVIGFYADREFTIGAVNPVPSNGVNPGEPPEWVKIRFDLTPGANLEDVVSELYTQELRVGIHIMNLPDNSSESAIMIVPEPATLSLLAIGAAALLRKRKAK